MTMSEEPGRAGRVQPGDRATDFDADGGSRMAGVMEGAQEAALKARAAAGEVADRMPAAVASAQEAVDETARTLNELPDQTLMLGAAFSLGVGVGMFLTGTNRLTVLLALVPAAAMAATLLSRESGRYPESWGTTATPG
jgi:phage-related tail protein